MAGQFKAELRRCIRRGKQRQDRDSQEGMTWGRHLKPQESEYCRAQAHAQCARAYIPHDEASSITPTQHQGQTPIQDCRAVVGHDR